MPVEYFRCQHILVLANFFLERARIVCCVQHSGATVNPIFQGMTRNLKQAETGASQRARRRLSARHGGWDAHGPLSSSGLGASHVVHPTAHHHTPGPRFESVDSIRPMRAGSYSPAAQRRNGAGVTMARCRTRARAGIMPESCMVSGASRSRVRLDRIQTFYVMNSSC